MDKTAALKKLLLLKRFNEKVTANEKRSSALKQKTKNNLLTEIKKRVESFSQPFFVFRSFTMYRQH